MLAAAAPFVTIRPAYAEPQTYSRDAIVDVYRLPSAGVAVFEGAIELLHAEVSATRVNAGETLRVVLYWGRATARPIRATACSLKATDMDGAPIGRTYALPYGGKVRHATLAAWCVLP
jgi:hypothetical protein